ncbi:MAG: sugar phosphate isomerase/epimerase [Clostridia bacterium]|nr:sugar phosphate isomerase/epimerase [Clostridia bacterium]
MRFGVCSSVDNVPRLKALGYDYIEANFSNVVKMTDEEYTEWAKKVMESGFKIETCNCFFPGNVILTGPDADISFVHDYVELGMSRVKPLGCEIVVLGSGKARNIPDGFDHETGIEQFCKLLKTVGDIAAKYDIKIAIEPLKAQETNLINTVQDCLDIVKRLNHPNVFALADFHHVFMSGESLDAIINAKELLIHTHLARANEDRWIPCTEEDFEQCKIWAEALKQNGYTGRMSLEGYFRPEFYESVEKVLPAIEIFKNATK